MNSDGTKEFIEHAVRQHSSMLLHLAASRLTSPSYAEDVVQEVFMKLLTAAPKFHDAEHEKGWLIRTTLNAACDYRRRASVRSAEPLLEEQAACIIREPSMLLDAVRLLPDKYCAVIHLYYYEGYSIKEISKFLRIPVPTVGTRLARGREKLKQLLKEEDL